MLFVGLSSSTCLPAANNPTAWDQLISNLKSLTSNQVSSILEEQIPLIKRATSDILEEQLPVIRTAASTIVTEQVALLRKATYAIFKQQIPRACYTGLAFSSGVIGLCITYNGFKRLCEAWETEKSKKIGATELSVGLGTTVASIIIINRLWK